MTDLGQARAAKEHLRAILGQREDVVGVGVCRRGSGYGVKVNVRDGAAVEQLPAVVDGVEVEITVVGTIRAQG